MQYKNEIITNILNEKKNIMIIDISNNIKLTENYIYTKIIDLDLKLLKKNCDIMYNFIKKHFSTNNKDYSGQSTLTTQLYNSYNLLLYPLECFFELYTEIKNVFHDILVINNMNDTNKKYYIQCWLNYYKKNEFIDWHGHWHPDTESWHGFYCLDVENSYTSYKIPNNNEIINIKSENNKIVISKSDGDRHKSSNWQYDHPRITIAFDIVPREHIDFEYPVNHWIPI
jgi:hypothetical protein